MSRPHNAKGTPTQIHIAYRRWRPELPYFSLNLNIIIHNTGTGTLPAYRASLKNNKKRRCKVLQLTEIEQAFRQHFHFVRSKLDAALTPIGSHCQTVLFQDEPPWFQLSTCCLVSYLFY